MTREEAERKFKRMQYTLALRREELGIKLKDLPTVVGVGKAAYQSVVYNPGGASIINVMRIADAFGYEIVMRRKEDDGLCSQG